jgi:hypothetical protein
VFQAKEANGNNADDDDGGRILNRTNKERRRFPPLELTLNKTRLDYTDVTFFYLTQEEEEELQSIGRACSDCDPKAPSVQVLDLARSDIQRETSLRSGTPDHSCPRSKAY